jgi:cytoskeletal protein CcmA (bactofilin family)
MWKRDEAAKPAPAGRDFSEGGSAERRPADNVIMDLGKSVRIKGELTASEDLTIYGQMEGTIRVPGHTLTIGPHAEIKAGIAAKSVVIMGAVTGNVTAAEKVEVRNTGTVIGDIMTQRLAIADGGCLCGKVQVPQSRSTQPA